MWYEALPSGIIVCVLFYIGTNAPWFLNKAVLGNPMRRNLEEKWDQRMLGRDANLHDQFAKGERWRSIGLETIPDKE